MADLDRDVLALLDRGAAGDVPDVDADALIRRGTVRRQRRRLTRIGSLIVVVALVIVGAFAATRTRSNLLMPTLPAPTGTGPTAEQIAHGTWVTIPAAPIKICEGNVRVWDGHELVVVDGGTGVCRSAAAFDPKTLTWQRLLPPPTDLHGTVEAVRIGDRVIVHAREDGAVAALDTATHRWSSLPSLPRSTYLEPALAVGTSRPTAIGTGNGRGVEQLVGNHWVGLGSLPRPKPGHPVHSEEVIGVGGAMVGGRLYAIEVASWWRKVRQGTSGTETTRLVVRDGNRWRIVHTTQDPIGTISQIEVAGSRLALTGIPCPPGAGCPPILGQTSQIDVVTPAAAHVDTITEPVHGAAGIAAGYDQIFTGSSVVDLYTSANRDGHSTGPEQIHNGSLAVFDLTLRHWLTGHATPAAINGITGESWTPDGLVVLGTPMEKCVCSLGGLLLHPSPSSLVRSRRG